MKTLVRNDIHIKIQNGTKDLDTKSYNKKNDENKIYKKCRIYKKNEENKFVQNAEKHYLVHLQSISQNNNQSNKEDQKI